MKKILIFAATSSLFTQEYDPYTGKPIRLPTKNIFTGQIQENETIPTVKLVVKIWRINSRKEYIYNY